MLNKKLNVFDNKVNVRNTKNNSSNIGIYNIQAILKKTKYSNLNFKLNELTILGVTIIVVAIV